ncbi:tyrosine-type recombinase/integrase [Agrococcus sp. KRD186]|uniref:tyrosine-type recombinase/integrase n=1 Tax=Agrococcus sp. KRD186 TaxID=2729730 RepID=UPI0019D1B166
MVARHERECIARLEEESGLRIPKPPLIPSDRPDLLTRASTLHEMVACWLESECHSGSIESASAASMAGHIRNHIAETIGVRRLDELNAYLLDRHLLLARRRFNPSVVRRTRSILIRALRLATVYGLITENFAELTRPVRLPSNAPIALSLDDIALVRARLRTWVTAGPNTSTVNPRQLRAIVEVALGTGLRLGELLALKVSAIDFESAQLCVEATVAWSPERGVRVEERLKRARQRRVLPLPPFALAAIHDAITSRSVDSELVFADSRGRVITSNAARQSLGRFMRETDLVDDFESIEAEDFKFKTLRSTVATHLARQLSLEDVRDQLGHASVATTARSYVAPLPMVNPGNGPVLQELFGPAGTHVRPHEAAGMRRET